eukprot:UN09803
MQANKYKDEETECQFFFNTGHCCNKIFHAFDLIVAGFMVMDSFFLLTEIGSFVGFLLPMYFAIFGILICLFVVYVPAVISASMPFYFTFTGRGILFLLVGSVIFVFNDELSVMTGIIVWVVAFTYLTLAICNKFCTKCDFGIALPQPLAQQKNIVSAQSNKPAKIHQANKRQQTPSSSYENNKIAKSKLKNMKTVTVDNLTQKQSAERSDLL